jgi:hypothetical protein
LKEKYGRTAHILTLPLFHGTSKNHPDLIFYGEEGFDMRLSREGYWGRAIYFAEKAAYSHTYAFQNPEGTKSLILA